MKETQKPASVEQQIKWENDCVLRGAENYYRQQDATREHNAEATDVMQRLLKDHMENITVRIKHLANTTTGKGAKYNVLLRSAVLQENYHVLTFIGLKTVFQNVMTEKDNTVLKICLAIATRIEAELKCSLFELEKPAYFNAVVSSLREQKVQSFQHNQKVLMKKFKEFGLEWTPWTSIQKTHIGSRILLCILEELEDYLFINRVWHRGKSTGIVDTTIAFDEWAGELEKSIGLMNPLMMPMLCVPKDWTPEERGGYYTPRMWEHTPFIKARGKDHKEFIKANGKPTEHIKAVNRLQKTAWRINERVFDVLETVYKENLGVGVPKTKPVEPPPFPEDLKGTPKELLTEEEQERISQWKMVAKSHYGRERERKGQVLSTIQTLTAARDLRNAPEFYFVYNCDFRGRIYCVTTGLSPQGADTARGIIEFKEEVELGDYGVKWLAAHGAAMFGVDKVSLEEQITWVKSNEDLIRGVAEDPVGNINLWSGADKPYQFVAFCFYWQECDYGRNKKHKSRARVSIDGSCNGLQHYSAMLRDSNGAKGVNLYPGDTPQDIYQEVAAECTELLKTIDDPRAEVWLEVGIDRKCAKRPVMTLPYGATKSSAREYILEYVIENWSKFRLEDGKEWEMAQFLTPVLWQAIEGRLNAAVVGMAWLRKQVKGNYVSWVTPIGFPVFQYYKSVQVIDIRTVLNGRMDLRLKDVDQRGKPNPYQQRNGIAPNFVHSLDSTHMVMVINRVDVPAYSMVHDEFGCHAAHVPELSKKTRQVFHALYTKLHPLEDWAEQQGVPAEEIPEKGSYNMDNVLNAYNFFR